MKAPTAEEIKLGYDGITAEGPRAQVTADLSILTALDPHLNDTMMRMYSAGVNLLSIKGEPRDVQGLICGALIYGLHLGLHIGEARGRNGAQEKESATGR